MTTSATATILPTPVGDLGDLAQWWRSDRGESGDADTAELGENIRVVADAVGENDVMAAALGAILINKDAANVMTWRVDAGTGFVDYEYWMRTCEQARTVAYTLRPHRADPENLYRELPDECRAIVDSILPEAQRPDATTAEPDRILVSGPFAAVATLLAYEINPDSYRTLRPLTLGASEIESLIWDYLRLTPVLPIRTAIPAHDLAPIAVDLINTAVRFTESIRPGRGDVTEETSQQREV